MGWEVWAARSGEVRYEPPRGQLGACASWERSVCQMMIFACSFLGPELTSANVGTLLCRRFPIEPPTGNNLCFIHECI